MKKSIALVLLSALISKVAFADAIEGLWYTKDQAAQVKVYQCDDSFCGDLVWLKEPTWDQADVEEKKGAVLDQPKLDLNNDDKKLRSRSILGITLLTGLKKSDENEYTKGKIYDAESGNTYSCEAELEDSADTLQMTGYIGVSWLGRTTTWTRVK
ncbi:DUF2147 domain-containing protein [Paraglaciecola sp. L3A3]|uniref:DUF2147 domain-containing protein n=1 Tax=Paraglaciecola sp. L3A3 TaxID=2686358 RepID=UPI00131C843D|nr:DUF2147 domain-containing protein [Paraglaciecola sp. L3A3]